MGGKQITLKFVPGAQISWKEFIATHPPHSIALDGYVEGITRFDETGPWANFNHHEDCVRSATKCTCKQVLDAIDGCLFETFKRCGRPYATVWCNDPDEDVALATYLLRHPSHADRRRLKSIIELEDKLDTFSGFYPVRRNWELLKMMIWFLHPYAEARDSGALDLMDGEEMGALVERVHGRIERTLRGRGGIEKPDTRHEILETHGKFAIVREIGHYARYEIARLGYEAFLSVTDLPNGRRKCTLTRKTPFVASVPVPAICAELNEAEGIPADAKHKWGGGDLVIGSPRHEDPKLAGTKLPFTTIVGVVLDHKRKVEARMCHTAKPQH